MVIQMSIVGPLFCKQDAHQVRLRRRGKEALVATCKRPEHKYYHSWIAALTTMTCDSILLSTSNAMCNAEK
jgi:hypothetical protein